MNRKPGWSGVGARKLLLRQSQGENEYAVLELLQEYLDGLDKTAGGKLVVYTAIRSFFHHNRVPLPEDRGYRIRSDKPSTVPKLALSHIVDLVKAADIRDRSIVLVKWQAMLDNTRLVYLGRNLAEQVVTQIRQGIHPVRLDLPGRKTNASRFYTFIGKDAVDALVDYFEKERGWPKPHEPIWFVKNHSGVKNPPLRNMAWSMIWMRLCRRIGLVPKQRGQHGIRYGYNPHEMRDIAKSLLHTNAKKDGFDMDCCDFWLGHTVDKLGYDKFMLDQEYVRKQYQIAERYLNILSAPLTRESAEERERMDRMEKELLELRGMLLERIKSEEILKKLGEPPTEEVKSATQ